jgi:hypothetical protein
MFYIYNIYTKYVKINVVIEFLMNILKNFPSIEYDQIVFLIIVVNQLKNLIFFLFNFVIIIMLYKNEHIFVIQLLLHYHLLILFFNRFDLNLLLIDFFFFRY